jgi:phosphopentomutase
LGADGAGPRAALSRLPHGFPAELIVEFEKRIGRATLGNVVASGTAIIDQLGPQHMETGRTIVYTSADSVFQIAAHEDVVPVPELYRICEIAYDLVAIGRGVGGSLRGRSWITRRVQAHGQSPRLRADAVCPHTARQAEGPRARVVAIGKIEDLFAGRGMTSAVHTTSDDHGMDEIEAAMARPPGLIFANLVDFDTVYGHRNESPGTPRISSASTPPRGAAAALRETTSSSSPPITATIRPRRAPITRASTCRCSSAASIGPDRRRHAHTFADLGQTLAELFGVGPLDHGTSFLARFRRVLIDDDTRTARAA